MLGDANAATISDSHNEPFNWPPIGLSIGRHLNLQSAGVRRYDWPMPPKRLYPRFAERRLRDAVADSPVVLIHGPRQCGKTTLARTFGESRGYRYVNFDAEPTRNAAEADPAGFVADLPRRVILDEVQHVPRLLPRSRPRWTAVTAPAGSSLRAPPTVK